MKNFKEILKGVKDVTDDSRSVGKGGLFIAVRGYSADGYKFIEDAVRRGAGTVVADRDFKAPRGVKKILVDDARTILPVIASEFYGHPSEKLKVIGVTGTNGKTTITYIIENILKEAGFDSGVIGTINYRIGNEKIPAKNTTPGALELQWMLARMAKEKVKHVVMEVSSHALDQGRVDGVRFDVGIFTNVTSEHLDYHRTIANYFKAKAKLFDRLKAGGAAILNNDDKRVAALKKAVKGKVVTYGVKEPADVKARDVKISLAGSSFSVLTPKGSFWVRTKLIGLHNVSNILASVAAASVLNIRPQEIRKGIESMAFIPGRLEPIEAGQPFRVFVDYAHTEDALYNILFLLRQVAKRKIITVFGCGGNRDRTKRPLMGKTACGMSDRVIITSDNPRFEDPKAIIGEIVLGIKGKFSNYDVAVDRREAIEKAFALASDGDIVVIAGKGHENYQVIKDKFLPFDDREVAMGILKAGYEGKRDIKDNAREAAVR